MDQQGLLAGSLYWFTIPDMITATIPFVTPLPLAGCADPRPGELATSAVESA